MKLADEDDDNDAIINNKSMIRKKLLNKRSK